MSVIKVAGLAPRYSACRNYWVIPCKRNWSRQLEEFGKSTLSHQFPGSTFYVRYHSDMLPTACGRRPGKNPAIRGCFGPRLSKLLYWFRPHSRRSSIRTSVLRPGRKELEALYSREWRILYSVLVWPDSVGHSTRDGMITVPLIRACTLIQRTQDLAAEYFGTITTKQQ